MIHTSLPYNIEDFDDIEKNGAIVDVSNPQFDGISENEMARTVLIYLRNTGFDVMLDFSNTSMNDKFLLLSIYANDDIECKDIQLRDTWIKMLCKYSGLHIHDELNSILTSSEEDIFISQNKNLLEKLINVYASLPIYLILRLNANNINMKDIAIDECTTIGVNFIQLIDDELLSNVDKLKANIVANYTKIFTLENILLFDALRKSVLGFIIFAANFDK